MPYASIAEAPMSGEWSNPTSWGVFFQTVGLPTGLLVLFVIIAVFFIYLALKWTIGPRGWLKPIIVDVGDSWKRAGNKVEECLPRVEAIMVSGAAERDKHLKYCEEVHAPGGRGNVDDLRAAGHNAARVLLEIGNKVGANVQGPVDKIHEALDGRKIDCDGKRG